MAKEKPIFLEVRFGLARSHRTPTDKNLFIHLMTITHLSHATEKKTGPQF